MPLRTRFEAAFDQETAAAFGQQYLDVLVTNLREIAQSLRRTVTAIAVLAIAFLLLAGAKSASFTLGPLKLTNVSAILILIPVLISILGYEWMTLTMAYAMYRDAIGETIRVTHRRIYDYNLEVLLNPPTIDFTTVGEETSWRELRGKPPGIARRVLYGTGLFTVSAIMVGLVTFLVYAYTHLYADKHANVGAVSASLVVALLFAVQTVALVASIEWDQDKQRKAVIAEDAENQTPS